MYELKIMFFNQRLNIILIDVEEYKLNMLVYTARNMKYIYL